MFYFKPGASGAAYSTSEQNIYYHKYITYFCSLETVFPTKFPLLISSTFIYEVTSFQYVHRKLNDNYKILKQIDIRATIVDIQDSFFFIIIIIEVIKVSFS